MCFKQPFGSFITIVSTKGFSQTVNYKKWKCTQLLTAAATIVTTTEPLSDFAVLFKIHSQLEGSLSQWTSYQEDVRQFVAWVERVEESLDPTDKQCPEMRDKTANLSKAKVLQSSQSYCILLRSI